MMYSFRLCLTCSILNRDLETERDKPGGSRVFCLSARVRCVDINQFRYAVEAIRSLFLRITSPVYSGPDSFTQCKSSEDLAMHKMQGSRRKKIPTNLQKLLRRGETQGRFHRFDDTSINIYRKHKQIQESATNLDIVRLFFTFFCSTRSIFSCIFHMCESFVML